MLDIKLRIKKALDSLEKIYHNESNHDKLLLQIRHEEPLDGLVLTILSQNTNDKNRDAAFGNLKSKWKKWESVAGLECGELADCIRTAGLSAIKSERIIFILKKIKSDFGEYSLKALKNKKIGHVREYLSSLPGIGPKTIACVMLFDLGLPSFPVDTHISRICKRLGFVPESTKKNVTPEEISVFMERNVPESRYLGSHVNIIEHGRSICKAQRPNCEICPVKDDCPFCLSS
ncbi:MAG: endonuclease III [Synergistaceae bacterium]|nr:endonuclease III [Synergistaceae bacterium]